MRDGIRVLHVDDDADFADVTATFLRREDDQIAVRTATSAADGLEQLTDDIDCVVSDYDMPGMNGIEFLETVREEYPDLPFVLFTGKGSEEVASDAISAGVTDYLQKESSSDQFAVLANRITNAVAQLRAEHELEQERQRFETLFERLTQPTVEVEYEGDDPIVQQVNPAFEDLFGFDASEIVGNSLDAYIVPDEYDEEASRINQRVKTGAGLNSLEVTRQIADGTREFLLQNAVYDDGSGGFAIYTDITDRKQREQRLETQRQQFEDLLDATRTLMTAESRDDIAARASETARDVLDLPLNRIYLYDTAREALVPEMVTDSAEEIVGNPPTIGPGDGVAWTAYETGEAQVYTDIREAPEFTNPDTPTRSECHLPIGDYGVLVAASTTADDFTEMDVTSAKILAAHLEAAFDRAERTKRQQEYLTALRVLHERTQSLMTSSNEQTIASRAVETARTVLGQQINGIWLYDETTDCLEPAARTDQSYDVIEDMPTYTGGDSLAWSAFEAGEMRVYDTLQAASDQYNPETAVASEIVLPLGEFGVLNIGATESQAFDDIDISLARIFGRIVETALERAEHERNLARSRELLRETEALAGTGGFEADIEAGKLRWTQGTYAIHDIPPDSDFEPTLESAVDFYHPEDQSRIERLVNRCIEHGDSYEAELRLLTTDDEVRWVRTTGVPIRENGSINAVRGAIQDITAQYNRERTLEQMVQRFAELINTKSKTDIAQMATEIASEVFDAPLAGVHLRSEDETRLEGVAANDFVREQFGVPPAYSREDDDTASELVWKAFERGTPLYLKDIEEYGTLSAETPAKSGLIHPLGDHGVFIVSATETDAFDATARSLIELVAQTVTSGLNRVEREADLRESRHRLQRQNERLDQFAGIISHDLRNPLNAAQLHLDLLRDEGNEEQIAEVERSLDRMESMIENLLTLSRAGACVADPQQVSLAAVTTESWETAQTDDAELEVLVDESTTVQADRDRLRHVFENLFRNAVDHNDPPVTVTVGVVDASDAIIEDGQRVGFFVEDDGDGIPEDEYDEIFAYGYTTSDKGMGFGLSIVEDVVAAHNWAISIAESHEGGARFEITGVDVSDRPADSRE